MNVGAFDAAVYGDRGFGASLCTGRCPRPRTVDRVLAVTGEPPADPALPGEVDDCLAATGIKRPLPGREATGNPSCVAQRLGGVSPKLATMEAVRASMKLHANAFERGIGARTETAGRPLRGPAPYGHTRSGGTVRAFTGRAGPLPHHRGRIPVLPFRGLHALPGEDPEATAAVRRGRRLGGVRAGDGTARRISS